MFTIKYNISVIISFFMIAFLVLGINLSFLGNLKLSVLCFSLIGLCSCVRLYVDKEIKTNLKNESFLFYVKNIVDVLSMALFPIVIGINYGLSGTLNTVVLIIYVITLTIMLSNKINILTNSVNNLIEKNNYYAIILPVLFSIIWCLFRDNIFTNVYYILIMLLSFLFLIKPNIKGNRIINLFLLLLNTISLIVIFIFG